MTVAIIGLAGADPGLAFDELGDEMPTLSGLAGRGVHGRLRSTDPPEPTPAWVSMLTGDGPGRTGVTGEVERDWQRTRQGREATYGEGRRSTFRHASSPALWERLAEAGHSSVLVDVPGTFPAEAIEGVLVADPSGGGRPDVHPPDLADEIGETFGQAPAAPGPQADADEGLAAAREETERTFAMAEHLAGEREAELLVAVTEGPRWAHRVADEQALAGYYRDLDERLASLVDELGEDATVIVVSERGTQPCRGSLRLNAWLAAEGYLSTSKELSGPRAFDPAFVDWSATQAWARGGPVGRVHLNVDGREPEGIVDPLDHEQLRDEIAEGLAELELDRPTHVLKPREVHDGPFADEGPDLYCYAGGLGYRCVDELGHEDPIGPAGPAQACTDLEGMFVLADPDGRYGGEVDGMQVTDVAATALEMLGQPAEELDGRVLQPDGSLQA